MGALLGGQPAAAGPGPGAGGGAAAGPGMGAGADLIRQQLEQQMGQIRGIADQVKQLAATNPAMAQGAQQIQEILKQMVIAAAQMTPQQTASSTAIPGAGM